MINEIVVNRSFYFILKEIIIVEFLKLEVKVYKFYSIAALQYQSFGLSS
jgi:hypothetical protein